MSRARFNTVAMTTGATAPFGGYAASIYKSYRSDRGTVAVLDLERKANEQRSAFPQYLFKIDELFDYRDVTQQKRRVRRVYAKCVRAEHSDWYRCQVLGSVGFQRWERRELVRRGRSPVADQGDDDVAWLDVHAFEFSAS